MIAAYEPPDPWWTTIWRALYWLVVVAYEALFGKPHVPAWDDVGDGFVSTVHA